MSQIRIPDELKQKLSTNSNWERYKDEILAMADYSPRKAYNMTVSLRECNKITRSQLLSGLDACIKSQTKTYSATAIRLRRLRDDIAKERRGLLAEINRFGYTQAAEIVLRLRTGKASQILSPKDIQTIVCNVIYYAFKYAQPEVIDTLFQNLCEYSVYDTSEMSKFLTHINSYRTAVIRDLCESSDFETAKSLAQLEYHSDTLTLSRSDADYNYIVDLEKTLIERKKAEAKARLLQQTRRVRRQAAIAAEKERRRQEYARKCCAVEQLLGRFDFRGADQLSNTIRQEDFLKLKAKYIQQWFARSVVYCGKPYTIDEEQACAVMDNHYNTLVAARAGSGKTRTIVAKIIFLIAKYNLTPAELLVFVFNSDAAKEINERLEQTFVNGRPIVANATVATTFHAFARKIVYEVCHEDEVHGQILAQEKPYFVQAIINEIPRQKIYQFFRDESFQIKRDRFNNETEYYEALRNSNYETLKGERVKSQAEKIIADFLFEHGINYYYENEYYLNSAYAICRPAERRELWKLKSDFQQESIKPDFYLTDYDIPWEHWAINGKESLTECQKINSSRVIGKYDDYLKKMRWKKWFYDKQWVNPDAQIRDKCALQVQKFRPIIETYKPADMSREEFERQIETILTARGVKCEKRPIEELIDEVWKSQIKRFSRMVSQFIDRAEQQFFDSQDVLQFKVSSFNGSPRVLAFLEIAHQCYKKYLAYLSGQLPKQNLSTQLREKVLSFDQYGIDFSLLIKRAIELIDAADNEDVVHLLSAKKYILIDEYQDFSRLFLEMIRSIRGVTTQAKLFAVGDDWQAINRFAGSDVDYFQNFEAYFPEETCHLEISTNYRCDRNIVANASAFVKNSMGDSGRYVAASQDDGLVCVLPANEVYIDYRAESGSLDDIFKRHMQIYAGRNPSKASTQYLKLIATIIQQNAHCDDILILHRNNETSFWFIDLEELRKRLRKTIIEMGVMSVNDFDAKVRIRTMHRAKGLEADVTIILEADEGIIPSYHQDVPLYEIFGETPSIALEDQKRLFYVAITRAKHRLYILHNNQKQQQKDGFIQDLDSRLLSDTGELERVFKS